MNAQLKREELARGAALLQYLEVAFPNVTFKKESNTQFRLEGYGKFAWRLYDDGFGTVKWYPRAEYKDIAHKKAMSRYNYTDGKSDVISLVTFVSEILEDLGL